MTEAVGASVSVNVTVNGKAHVVSVDSRHTLADFLRDDLGLTGLHLGCEHGVCGACTVLMDGVSVRSCLLLAVQADGTELVTVEGISPEGGGLSPLQDCFRESHALQCGFCTPGFLITAHELLQRCADPDERTVREYLSGNLCRCTGYIPIIRAVQAAAKRKTGSGGGS